MCIFGKFLLLLTTWTKSFHSPKTQNLTKGGLVHKNRITHVQNKDIIIFVMLIINIKEQTTISAKLLGLTMVFFYLKTEVSVLFPFVNFFFFFFLNKFWKFVEMNIIQLKIDQPTSNAKIEQYVWFNSTHFFKKKNRISILN